MSDSVRPHRRQPTRLPCPWDSPGKNTGVGCHFLLQRMKVKRESEVAQSGPTLSDPMDCSPPGSSIHGIFQARVLEWVAISFSRGSSQPRDQTRSPTLHADTLTSELPVACGILIPQPGSKPTLRAQSLNHWTTRKVPRNQFPTRQKVSYQRPTMKQQTKCQA